MIESSEDNPNCSCNVVIIIVFQSTWIKSFVCAKTKLIDLTVTTITLSPSDGPKGPKTNTVKDNFQGVK